jgi:hypothetical protein
VAANPHAINWNEEILPVRPSLAVTALAAPIAVAAALITNFISRPAAADALAECNDFFAKFEKCADGLKGEQQEEARVYIKTLRGTLGMNDALNQGDPMLTGMMCSLTIKEMKKEPDIQKYNCAW